jgi:hypothetical protein
LKALSYSCSQQKRQDESFRGPQECLHKLHQISYNLDLERFIIRFSDFDLSHVNEALIQHKSKPVHGIIGGRIIEGKSDCGLCKLFFVFTVKRYCLRT